MGNETGETQAEELGTAFRVYVFKVYPEKGICTRKQVLIEGNSPEFGSALSILAAIL